MAYGYFFIETNNCLSSVQHITGWFGLVNHWRWRISFNETLKTTPYESKVGKCATEEDARHMISTIYRTELLRQHNNGNLDWD